MSRALALLGAGGHARVVIAAARAGGLTVQALYDADPDRRDSELDAVPVLGADDQAFVQTHPLHIAIGDNRLRRSLAGRRPPGGWVEVVDPTAHLAEGVQLGQGAFVALGALIQPGARIGGHAIINTGAIIEHDSLVEDFAHVAPGAVLGGEVRIGAGALIGLGARIAPGVRVGSWSTVGAGAVVTQDVAGESVVVGVPARPVS